MPTDTTEQVISEAIAEARVALEDLARQEPARWWTAYELKVRARNGWSSGIMGLALRQLLDDEVFEQSPEDLRVRLKA